MIINVDNFYNVHLAKDKDYTILAIDPEAENLEPFRFKKFDIETRMKDIFFEKLLLLRKFLNELMLL